MICTAYCLQNSSCPAAVSNVINLFCQMFFSRFKEKCLIRFSPHCQHDQICRNLLLHDFFFDCFLHRVRNIRRKQRLPGIIRIRHSLGLILFHINAVFCKRFYLCTVIQPHPWFFQIMKQMSSVCCTDPHHKMRQHFQNRNVLSIFICQPVCSLTAYHSTAYDHDIICTFRFFRMFQKVCSKD